MIHLEEDGLESGVLTVKVAGGGIGPPVLNLHRPGLARGGKKTRQAGTGREGSLRTGVGECRTGRRVWRGLWRLSRMPVFLSVLEYEFSRNGH